MILVIKWQFQVIILMHHVFSESKAECGLSLVDQTNLRIIGGRTAEEKEFPWHAALFRYNPRTKERTYQCGAAILNEYWVVTAAHCISRVKSSLLRLGVGSIDLNKIKVFDLEKSLRHKKYIPATYENDIAIVKTVKPMKLSMYGHVNNVCLPKKSENIFGTATVTGFGVKQLRTNPEELMSVEVEVYQNSICKKAYGKKFRKGMICAGSERGGEDACQGDSGGPLIKRIDGRAILIGIVSWGVGCGRKEYPGVYTDIKHYLRWIQRFVNTSRSAKIHEEEGCAKAMGKGNSFAIICLYDHPEKGFTPNVSKRHNVYEIINTQVATHYLACC
ncbi:Serine proteinase stubble-like protein [Dinothrombium tinctorium]|uniref:Serine proteinase stubble-like protein n=1 Tax=Dinothrombium tinctorium TaxID=1965070 RepID=A0A3S3NYZ3_9ACAR|nr:Serine proteinase stubble-like protein [Dinothrombium tinctorium]RWS11918.1 Serine proteinase stubble-like protein [Dinothrombium tinctorium]